MARFGDGWRGLAGRGVFLAFRGFAGARKCTIVYGMARLGTERGAIPFYNLMFLLRKSPNVLSFSRPGSLRVNVRGHRFPHGAVQGTPGADGDRREAADFRTAHR